jgi:hypothetical protein
MEPEKAEHPDEIPGSRLQALTKHRNDQPMEQKYYIRNIKTFTITE